MEHRIITTCNGDEILVDAEDFERLSSFKWFVIHSGVVRNHPRSLRGVDPTSRIMPRMLMGLENNDRRQVDHINGNRLDNRKCNLRVCTHAENNRNKTTQSNNTSGFKGVCFFKRKQKFHARVVVDGKAHHLGYFDTAEEAYKAYCKAALRLHGEFANLDSRRLPLLDRLDLYVEITPEDNGRDTYQLAADEIRQLRQQVSELEALIRRDRSKGSSRRAA